MEHFSLERPFRAKNKCISESSVTEGCFWTPKIFLFKKLTLHVLFAADVLLFQIVSVLVLKWESMDVSAVWNIVLKFIVNWYDLKICIFFLFVNRDIAQVEEVEHI